MRPDVREQLLYHWVEYLRGNPAALPAWFALLESADVAPADREEVRSEAMRRHEAFEGPLSGP